MDCGDGTRTAVAYDFYETGAASPRLFITAMPASSEVLMLYNNYNSSGCATHVSIEHETSWKDSPICAADVSLARGFPVKASSSGTSSCSGVHIRIGSGGYYDGNFAAIWVNGKNVIPSAARGFNVAVLHRDTHALVKTGTFDTSQNDQAASQMTSFLTEVVPGDIIVIAAKEDAQQRLEPVLSSQLTKLGANTMPTRRASMAIIAIKGYTGGTTGSAAMTKAATSAYYIDKMVFQGQTEGRKGVFLEKTFGCSSLGSSANARSETDWKWMLNKQRTCSLHPLALTDGLGNDNNADTYWTSIGQEDASWQVDLGAMKAISEVRLSFKWRPLKLALLASSDGATWHTAATVDEGIIETCFITFRCPIKWLLVCDIRVIVCVICKICCH